MSPTTGLSSYANHSRPRLGPGAESVSVEPIPSSVPPGSKPAQASEPTPVVTYAVIAICVAVSALVTGFEPTKESLTPVAFSTHTMDEHPERFLFSQFAHGGYLHLLMNMVALLSFGAFVEGKLGAVKFTFLYLLAGSAGNLAHALFQPDTPIVGASGAIFGLLGVVVILSPTLKVEILNLIPAPILLVGAVYAAFVPLLVHYEKTVPIAHEAHIGGMVAGGIFGILLKPLWAVQVVPAAIAVFYGVFFLVDGFLTQGGKFAAWKIVAGALIIVGPLAYLYWLERKHAPPEAVAQEEDLDPY